MGPIPVGCSVLFFSFFFFSLGSVSLGTGKKKKKKKAVPTGMGPTNSVKNIE